MAITYQKKLNSNTSFAIWKMEESIDELRAQLQLNEQEEQFIQSIHHDKRKLHWLGARALLRAMLNTTQYIDCRVDDQGKLFLVDLPYSISISHSFDYAAAILSDTHQVGIDIELINPKIEALAPKFLSPEEQSFIDDAHRTEHLYACWCAKEAIYKLHGKRGVSLLKDIRLHPFAYQEKGKVEADLLVDGSSFVAYFEKFGEYMVSWVVF